MTSHNTEWSVFHHNRFPRIDTAFPHSDQIGIGLWLPLRHIVGCHQVVIGNILVECLAHPFYQGALSTTCHNTYC